MTGKSYRQLHPRRKHVVQDAHCQYHGPSYLRTVRSLIPGLIANGWRDTLRHGLICPDCLVKHPDLGRLKERTVPTP